MEAQRTSTISPAILRFQGPQEGAFCGVEFNRHIRNKAENLLLLGQFLLKPLHAHPRTQQGRLLATLNELPL